MHSLVWIDQRAQHRSLERSWEIFWQPKWVSVSSVMSRSIRSLQTVYPQWVKIAPHIDATGIRGIIDACVCARVYIYIYILPSVSCHFPRLGTRFIVRMPRLDRHVSRGGEDPKVASPAVSWFFLGF